MKGLLLKDWLVIVRQSKIYFVLLAVFALMPQMGIYCVFFGALLPTTAFAYDERSHWDIMERMMPYSSWNVVAEKYVFGYLMVGGIVLMEMAVQAVYCLTGANPLGIEAGMRGIWIPAVAALSMTALEMPVIFWVGVEKTRMFLVFASIGAMMALQYAFVPGIFGFYGQGPELGLPVELLAVGGAVILQILSLLLSKKLYQRHSERKRPGVGGNRMGNI